MQIVRQRDRKKQQNEGDADGGPFPDRIAGGTPPLVHPTRAPSAQEAQGYQCPENIKE